MDKLENYRSMRRLSFEIELGGIDVTGRYGGGAWRGADYLVTEGHTLEDLIKNQTVWVVDQDGGEAGELEGWDETDKYVTDRFKEELDKNPWLFYSVDSLDPMGLSKEASLDVKFSRD